MRTLDFHIPQIHFIHVCADNQVSKISITFQKKLLPFEKSGKFFASIAILISSLHQIICTKLTSSTLNTFRGEDVNLVLSWEFSANQNRAFYMQRSTN